MNNSDNDSNIFEQIEDQQKMQLSDCSDVYDWCNEVQSKLEECDSYSELQDEVDNNIPYILDALKKFAEKSLTLQDKLYEENDHKYISSIRVGITFNKASNNSTTMYVPIKIIVGDTLSELHTKMIEFYEEIEGDYKNAKAYSRIKSNYDSFIEKKDSIENYNEMGCYVNFYNSNKGNNDVACNLSNIEPYEEFNIQLLDKIEEIIINSYNVMQKSRLN